MSEIRTITTKQQDTERGVRAAADFVTNMAQQAARQNWPVQHVQVLEQIATQITKNAPDIATHYKGK